MALTHRGDFIEGKPVGGIDPSYCHVPLAIVFGTGILKPSVRFGLAIVITV